MTKFLTILKYVPVLFNIAWGIRKYFVKKKLEKLMSQTLGIDNTKVIVDQVNEAIKTSILALRDGLDSEDLLTVPKIVGNIMKIFGSYAEAKAEQKDLTLEEKHQLTTFVVDEVFETLKALK